MTTRRSCSIETCERPHLANGLCSTHNARASRGQPLIRPCVTCGSDIMHRTPNGWCSEACRPAPGPGVVGACVVCGEGVLEHSGRRKHCSTACQVADSRHRLTGQERPTESVCALCGKAFSLRRNVAGRLQRTDTLWCPDCGRESPGAVRFKRYGITPDQYATALERGCEICHRKVDRLHVDHDHGCCDARKFRTCGKCVRGLICGPCNRALGMFQDDVAALQRAIDYLTKQP